MEAKTVIVCRQKDHDQQSWSKYWRDVVKRHESHQGNSRYDVFIPHNDSS